MIQSYLSQVNAIDVITFIFYILILYIAFLYTLRIVLNWKYNNKMSKVIQEEKSMINALEKEKQEVYTRKMIPYLSIQEIQKIENEMVYQKNKTRVKYNVLRNKRARINKIRKEIKYCFDTVNVYSSFNCINYYNK